MIFGIILIIVIGGLYFFVRWHKKTTYTGTATATVVRHENPVTIKPYQVQLFFTYEVGGRTYQGTTVQTSQYAKKVGETMAIAYHPDKPEKYLVP